MRKGLRALAGIIALGSVVLWLVTGAHTGWTQTQVTRIEIDPVTELTYPVTTKQFVAGVDALGAGALLAVVTFGASFVFRPSPTHNRKATTP